jgi:uncharacterized coiled-coil DUF342 family protein
MKSNEFYIAKGQLVELEREYKDINRRCESLLIQIREELNPIKELFDFDLEKVLELVKEFRRLQLEARDIQTKIDKIKETYNL